MLNRHHWLCLVPILISTAACKSETSTTLASSESATSKNPVVASPTSSSPSNSAAPADAPNPPPPICPSITPGDGAVCPAPAAAPKVPKLFDGISDTQIGDYLISVTRGASGELITVWIEKEDAVLLYQNGVVFPSDQAVYYNSINCSGDGVYKASGSTDPMLGMGDRIVYWDRYYKIGREVTHCYPRSKKEKNGACTEITGPMSGDFNGFVASPANPGVTSVLMRGYAVKVK